GAGAAVAPAGAPFGEAGAGRGVVCLPASASSSGQWRPLMDRLAGRFRTLAADLYGAGHSPAWPGDRPLWLADEAALLAPVFGAAGPGFPLVGHSSGGGGGPVGARGPAPGGWRGRPLRHRS